MRGVQSNIRFYHNQAVDSHPTLSTQKSSGGTGRFGLEEKACGYAVTASNGLGRTIIARLFFGSNRCQTFFANQPCQLLASFWSFAKDREHENCCNCRSWMQMDISHILKWINELRLDLRRWTTLRCTELRHQLTIGCRARASTATLLTQWSATSLSGSVPLVTALSIVLASNAHSRARERIWGVALDALPFDAILWDGRVQLIIIPERHASVTIASGSSERASFPVLETLAFVELAGGLIETQDPNPENTRIKDEPKDRQRSAQARCFALFKWGNDFWLDALMQDTQYWQRSRQKMPGNSFTQDTQRISPNILKSQVLAQPHEPSPPPLSSLKSRSRCLGKENQNRKICLAVQRPARPYSVINCLNQSTIYPSRFTSARETRTSTYVSPF